MQSAGQLKKFVNLHIVPDNIDTTGALFDEDLATKSLSKKIASFVNQLDDDFLNIESWSIFNAWLDCHVDTNSDNYDIFRSWQHFQWEPQPDTVKLPLFNTATPTIAAAFSEKHAPELTPTERLILDNSKSLRLDFFEVVGVQDDYVTLFGTIYPAKVAVFNGEVSSKARIGEFLFANVMPVDSSRHVFLGRSALLPTGCHKPINEFRDFVARCKTMPREFKSFESDVFNLFYDLTRECP